LNWNMNKFYLEFSRNKREISSIPQLEMYQACWKPIQLHVPVLHESPFVLSQGNEGHPEAAFDNLGTLNEKVQIQNIFTRFNNQISVTATRSIKKISWTTLTCPC
jgi:hypothetical protein